MILIESRSIELVLPETNETHSFDIYQYEDEGITFWTASCTTDPDFFKDRYSTGYTTSKPY